MSTGYFIIQNPEIIWNINKEFNQKTNIGTIKNHYDKENQLFVSVMSIFLIVLYYQIQWIISGIY